MTTPTREKPPTPAGLRPREAAPTAPRRISGQAVALLLLLEVVMAALALGGYRYSRAIPDLRPSIAIAAGFPAVDPADAVPWPARGQAVLYVEGAGTLVMPDSTPGPLPIASTTKVMTALLILERHPLAPGERGPMLTLSQDDVRRYQQAIDNDESAIDVRAGESISQLELLQGLLVPSANNFAEILARWDAGSIPAFVSAMNERARALGMSATHFDDPSGLSPRTVSTATDLLVLARTAVANPTFAAIVGQREANLPVVGTVSSTNALLGIDGVTGIKTGHTDEAGGCFIFSFEFGSGSSRHTAIGVVLGQRNLADAFLRARDLIAATPGQLVTTHAVSKGDPVAYLTSAWDGSHPVVAGEDGEIVTLGPSPITTGVALATQPAPLAPGAKVGELTLTAGGQQRTIALVAGDRIPPPGPLWRIRRN